MAEHAFPLESSLLQHRDQRDLDRGQATDALHRGVLCDVGLGQKLPRPGVSVRLFQMVAAAVEGLAVHFRRLVQLLAHHRPHAAVTRKEQVERAWLCLVGFVRPWRRRHVSLRFVRRYHVSRARTVAQRRKLLLVVVHAGVPHQFRKAHTLLAQRLQAGLHAVGGATEHRGDVLPLLLRRFRRRHEFRQLLVRGLLKHIASLIICALVQDERLRHLSAHDRVRVRPAEAERRDRDVLAACSPGDREMLLHDHALLLVAQNALAPGVALFVGVVQVRWYQPVRGRQTQLHQARHRGRALRVPHVGFHGTQQQRQVEVVPPRTRRRCLSRFRVPRLQVRPTQSLQLLPVPGRGSRAVRLDVENVRRIDHRAVADLLVETKLRLPVGKGDALLGEAVGIDAKPKHLEIRVRARHPLHGGLRVGSGGGDFVLLVAHVLADLVFPVQHHDRDPLGPCVPVPVLREAHAGGVFRKHAQLIERDGDARVQRDTGTPDEANVALARLQRAARLGKRDQRGTAGGVHVEAGAVEIVKEGEAVRVHGLRAAGVFVPNDGGDVVQPGFVAVGKARADEDATVAALQLLDVQVAVHERLVGEFEQKPELGIRLLGLRAAHVEEKVVEVLLLGQGPLPQGELAVEARLPVRVVLRDHVLAVDKVLPELGSRAGLRHPSGDTSHHGLGAGRSRSGFR
mmetsp:Transcript_18751/g.46868  ORF Transcript_18751/g.46868 Transcript_18751/m.46868 type:complete len:683 (-) Transcript_18751:652-2700(-)